MASRGFVKGDTYTLDRRIVRLWGRVVFGVASITSQDCLGFTVSRTGVGLFTFTLDDKYPASEANAAGTTTSPLLAADCQLLAAAASTGTLRLITDTVASAKTFTAAWDVASAAADPATGSQWLVEIVLRNTGAPRRGV